ncbi:TPA: toprim domain-containing protein [Legionella pneumophila]|nr:hypothetical protein [Legionella pneumophila]HBD7410345.1 toprim domain-containing protein [Legionella pneumophila]HBD9405538.1 toprim domain-containing protein [Legionella pneumophila]HBI2968767.1 toprim domain-containing protein [Legionella pneumophila]
MVRGIFAARNEKGEITGVQRIYLDHRTASKNRFMDNPKLSKGVMEGSCGVMQKGMRGSRLYIAEGPETAASIAMADGKATVLVSFGISNMKNLASVIKNFNPKEVVIAADNDGSMAKSQQEIFKTVEELRQNKVDVRPIFPSPLEGRNKTDWNDILQAKGVAEIQKQLLANDTKNLHSLISNTTPFLDRLPSIVVDKSIKLTDSLKLSVQNVSASLHKETNPNKMVAEFQKHNQLSNRNNITTVSKEPVIKIVPELEREL